MLNNQTITYMGRNITILQSRVIKYLALIGNKFKEQSIFKLNNAKWLSNYKVKHALTIITIKGNNPINCYG